MSRFVFDIEANGFLMDATKVWCAVAKDIDTNEIYKFGPQDIDLFIKLLKTSSLLVGHNITLYDLPLLQRLYGLEWENLNIQDTFLWSRLLRPDQKSGHSLGNWGVKLGFPKTGYTDFSKYTPEMLQYCENDVEVNFKLFHHLRPHALKYLEALEIENKFAYIISRQVLNGFRLDLKFAQELKKELDTKYNELYSELQAKMPKVRVDGHFNSVLKSGHLLNQSGDKYTYTTPKTKKVVTTEFKYKNPNPRSRQQIISYLQKTYGWAPKEMTDKDNLRINEAILNTLDYPDAKLFNKMFRLNKQISMIENWLDNLRGDRTHGNVMTIGTVTGRCTHSNPNMAQVNAKDIRMRQCWMAKEGWDLISFDADQLEARILAHYTYPFDNGELKRRVLSGNFHLENQKACGLKEKKTAKTAYYAYIYGAGDKKLALTVAAESPLHSQSDSVLYKIGKQVRNNLNKSMVGITELTKRINMTLANRGYLYGLDGRPLYIRSEYAALNTLGQSAGAVVMKQALIEFWTLVKKAGYKYGEEWGLTANVHDEFVFECRPDIADHMKDLCSKAIKLAEEKFELKCPLSGEAQIGKNWAEIH